MPIKYPWQDSARDRMRSSHSTFQDFLSIRQEVQRRERWQPFAAYAYAFVSFELPYYFSSDGHSKRSIFSSHHSLPYLQRQLLHAFVQLSWMAVANYFNVGLQACWILSWVREMTCGRVLNLNLDIDVFQPLDKKIIAFEFWSKQGIWKMDRLSYLLSCKDSNIYIPAVWYHLDGQGSPFIKISLT